MALSERALALLNQIYAHRGHGKEAIVDENPDEALEYVLQEIARSLDDRHRHASPLYIVIERAVGRLSLERRERQKAEQEVETS